jgi:hypothetical protein
MNKNITMLAQLYDNAAFDLQSALKSEKVTFNDPRIADKVKWLGEVAKTLSLVYQIESMRAKSANKEALALPDEQVVEDPVIKRAQKGQPQFKPNNTTNDLQGFRSPGGWVP